MGHTASKTWPYAENTAMSVCSVVAHEILLKGVKKFRSARRERGGRKKKKKKKSVNTHPI